MYSGSLNGSAFLSTAVLTYPDCSSVLGTGRIGLVVREYHAAYCGNRNRKGVRFGTAVALTGLSFASGGKTGGLGKNPVGHIVSESKLGIAVYLIGAAAVCTGVLGVSGRHTGSSELCSCICGSVLFTCVECTLGTGVPVVAVLSIVIDVVVSNRSNRLGFNYCSADGTGKCLHTRFNTGGIFGDRTRVTGVGKLCYSRSGSYYSGTVVTDYVTGVTCRGAGSSFLIFERCVCVRTRRCRRGCRCRIWILILSARGKNGAEREYHAQYKHKRNQRR